MKRTNWNLFAMLIVALVLISSVAMARPTVLNDRLTVDTGGTIDFFGKLEIDSVEVTASATELNYNDGVTSDVQTQLDAITGTYALLTQVWGSAGVVGATNSLVNTVAITRKDIAGSTLADTGLLRIWISETDLGAASTNNIETLILSTGTAVQTMTANADYKYVTSTNGTAVATITATAAGTNYLMVSDSSTVSSGAVVFD